MQKKILAEIPDYPASKIYQPTKTALTRIDQKLTAEKNLSNDKKENYAKTIRQISYTLEKTAPLWPIEVERMVDNMKSILEEFQGQLAQLSKGSSLFCGSSGNPKQLEQAYRRLCSYENIFTVIRIYQDQNIKKEIVRTAIELLDREKTQDSKNSRKQQQKQTKFQTKIETKSNQRCNYCQLMLSVSLCPNGYIAKKLIKQLPDTEWIAGILHEEGNIVDKDLDKAIIYYEQARKKKNNEALYRLGSLNERGLYGKPYDYLKMWEQASANGHLEALTDMGYLYENGLEDEETGRVRIEPNPQKAFAYYKKASEQNFPRALNNLATFYFSNQKYKDPKKCLQYLELAAEAQYVKSLHNLGLIYYQGKLVNYDEVKSKNLIKRAAEKGDIEGRIMYIEMMLNDVQQCSGDTLVQLNRYCRQIIAKDEQNADAYYFLGFMYEEGYGVAKMPKNAFLYYGIAASMQNQAALMKLGQCYKSGFGTEQDAREAIRYFERASKTNHQALISLGQIYQKGAQDLNANYERAFQYYYEACNYNIAEGFVRVANMYKYGRHVKKNEAKAEEYYQKAKNLERKGNQVKLNSSSSDLIQSSYYRRR